MKASNFLLVFSLTMVASQATLRGHQQRPGQLFAPLDDKAKENLLFLRQDIKLARDVYLKLFDLWREDTFSLLAHSEQRHMNQVLQMIHLCGLRDPVRDNSDQGDFDNNSAVQTLYNDMVTQASTSLDQAIRVVALMEETDISDLDETIAETLTFVEGKNENKKELLDIYKTLKRSSGLHLHDLVILYEEIYEYGTYEPRILSDPDFNDIITSLSQRGRIGTSVLDAPPSLL